MILIVVTDEQPVAALPPFSRPGFILLPLSLLFIKYYPNLGRSTTMERGAGEPG